MHKTIQSNLFCRKHVVCSKKNNFISQFFLEQEFFCVYDDETNFSNSMKRINIQFKVFFYLLFFSFYFSSSSIWFFLFFFVLTLFKSSDLLMFHIVMTTHQPKQIILPVLFLLLLYIFIFSII